MKTKEQVTAALQSIERICVWCVCVCRRDHLFGHCDHGQFDMVCTRNSYLNSCSEYSLIDTSSLDQQRMQSSILKGKKHKATDLMLLCGSFCIQSPATIFYGYVLILLFFLLLVFYLLHPYPHGMRIPRIRKKKFKTKDDTQTMANELSDVCLRLPKQSLLLCA